MILLLVCSAFFSGSETALFSLSRRQINQFAASRHRLCRIAAALMNNPSRLLGCVLFGNMTVNVLFCAIASVLIVRIKQQTAATTAAAVAAASFGMLLLFGEVLPKSLAYINAKSISIIAALPLFICDKIFAPLQFVFHFFLIEPTLKILLGHHGHTIAVTTNEFLSLIEQVRKRGIITDDEHKLIDEIVELGFLKVRNVVQPRVDMIACKVTEPAQNMIRIMQENHLTKMPLYAGKIDNIVGQICLRQLLLHPDSSIDKLVQEINFVPEQKKVESLLEFFCKTGTDTAVVVDEYGGIAGLVSLENIVEEIVGPIETTAGIEPVSQIGPVEYRLAGNLPIHDWAKALGIDAYQMRVSTLGGLVTAALGRIPKPGDVAYMNNLKFTVERMKKRRIETLILTLQPLNESDNRGNEQ